MILSHYRSAFSARQLSCVSVTQKQKWTDEGNVTVAWLEVCHIRLANAAVNCWKLLLKPAGLMLSFIKLHYENSEKCRIVGELAACKGACVYVCVGKAVWKTVNTFPDKDF